MPIVKFTPAFMASGLVCPADKKRIEYSVEGGPGGLFAEVRSAPGAIPTWYLRVKNAKGTNEYKRLGTVKEMTLTQARKQAGIVKAEHAVAIEQQSKEQKPAVGEMTLDTFWTKHYLPHAKLHKRSWKRDDQLYRCWLKEKFGSVKLTDLTRSQFLQYQAELANTKLKPASQDHVLKQARRTLAFAQELQLLERNVLKGIKLRMVDNQLHDVATPEQLQRYIEVLRTDSNRPVCNILMFLLTTGARLGEVLKLTEDQLDMEKGLWTIPAANAKSKKSRTVPLNDSALYVLAEADKLKKTQFVFANPDTGLPFTTITRVRHRLQKLAGVTMRAHSLRHQFADLLLAGGRSLYDVQVLLGHSDPRVSQRYAKLSMNALQQASSVASILVPKPQPAPTPSATPSEPVGAVLTQEEDIAALAPQPPKETPASNIVPFPKAA